MPTDIDCKDHRLETVYEHRSGHCPLFIVEVRHIAFFNTFFFSFSRIQYKLIEMDVGIQCGHLTDLPNGQIVIEKSNGGEIAKYSCNDNYSLVGSRTRFCQSNGTWSESQPECISM